MIAHLIENNRYRLDCKKPNTWILLLYFTFGYMGIFLYSPSLPDIAVFFQVSEGVAQFTEASYLLGYGFSQLFYGPFANRFGRKKAIIFSLIFALIGTALCISTYYLKSFYCLVFFRILQAFGACASVCMTFTVVNDFYYPSDVKKIVSYLIVSVGLLAYLLAVWLGGWLTDHFGWVSCFWALGIFAVFLLLIVNFLPETATSFELDVIKPKVALSRYTELLQDKSLVLFSLTISGLAMLLFYYVAAAPFVSSNILQLSASTYGTYSILTAVGFTLGGIAARICLSFFSAHKTVLIGIAVIFIGSGSLFIFTLLNALSPFTFFIPSAFIFFGQSIVFPVISSFALEKIANKAMGSATMVFIYVFFAFVLLLVMGFVRNVTAIELSIILLVLNIYVWILYYLGYKYGKPSKE